MSEDQSIEPMTREQKDELMISIIRSYFDDDIYIAYHAVTPYGYHNVNFNLEDMLYFVHSTIPAKKVNE